MITHTWLNMGHAHMTTGRINQAVTRTAHSGHCIAPHLQADTQHPLQFPQSDTKGLLSYTGSPAHHRCRSPPPKTSTLNPRSPAHQICRGSTRGFGIWHIRYVVWMRSHHGQACDPKSRSTGWEQLTVFSRCDGHLSARLNLSE